MAIAEIAPVSPIVSALATLLLIAWMLRARNRWPLDVPNERSLHARPVPRSGGIAMMAGVFSGFAILQTPLVVVLPAAMLVALSHFDDLRGLPISVRFGAQLAAAAGFAFGAFPAVALPFLVLIVIGILWLTNLYNFMDGSDGLAGGMTVTGFAFLGAGAWMSGDDALLIECAIVAAAGAAFLPFNFPPARLFMGDAGSVPIGFLAAVLSLSGWRDGDWPLWFPAAVFAPFIADATLLLPAPRAHGLGPPHNGTRRICFDARLRHDRALGATRAAVPAAVRPYRANRAPCGAGSVGGPRVAAPRRPSR